jgi:exportin-T
MTHFFELSAMLSNPSAVLPKGEHQKLLQEFENVKESENGWKDCAQLLVSDQVMNDQTKFFCMQIIEAYLKNRYIKSSQEEQVLLKQFMSTWLQMQTTRKANEKNFITRKAAQIFSLVSLIDFPNRWPTFFNDLMATSSWSDGNADFYLKCLLAIDSEIVDRELPRTQEEMNTITFYKDSIRTHCMNLLVDSWFQLLKEHCNKNATITCQTLEVIGAYIRWIEINLVVNDRFVEFFSFALGHVDLRETTCACLEEIINKGMDTDAKLKLIDYLWTNVIQVHANALEQQINLSNDDEDNSDYLLKFGKIINAVGENLFDGWVKLNKKEPQKAVLLMQCLETKFSYVLNILSHIDDDISESVNEYCTHYISILKVMKIQSREQQSNIENMFHIVINKMKFDSSFNFENEGEEEAMFLEYRKNIRLLFDNITQLDNDFALSKVKTYVLDTTANWQVRPFADIENALYLLYLIGEAIPSSNGNHFVARTHKSDCLGEMIQSTIQSNLIQNPHRIVKFQYFENLVRYSKFFTNYNPQLIETVVEHFIGEHGLHNNDPKLRSRVSYLFSRFTKDLKNLVSNYVEKILNTIQDLLVIWSPLESSNKKLENDGPLSADDQLFIYETVSVLTVSSSLQPSVKSQLMKSLLTPTVSCFQILINKYCEASDEKTKLVYANCLNTAMSVASRASKGFSNQIKVKDCDCVEIFLEILRIFMPAININTHKSLIHAGIRQYLHRMIVCLDSEVLEYLPLTIEHLIKMSNEPKDLYDIMPLINQILNKYKQKIVPFMQHILMQIVNTTLNFVNSMPRLEALAQTHILKLTPLQLTNASAIDPSSTKNTENELSIDAQLILDAQTLYKAYFQFLYNVANADLMDIFVGQNPQDVYKIYQTLLEGAQNGTTETVKICFQTIRKFFNFFVDKQEMPDFVQYTLQNVVPCCFHDFFRNNIDLNDAQQCLVFNEIGQCLTLLHKKFGDDFLKYLECTFLPTLHIDSQLTQAILQTVKSNNPKGLKALRESLQHMNK